MSWRKHAPWLALALIVVLAGAAWFFFSPSNPFPVSDSITSWQLQKPQDYATAAPKINADIAKLEGYMGTTTYPASDLYLGIANDYLLLGDGKNAYRYYGKALAASSTEPVIYNDLGSLFARLHATSTAKRAYAKAVLLAPTIAFYQLAYIDYLALIAPADPATLAAFNAAGASLGGNEASYMMARASWLASIGSTTAAIAAWQDAAASVDPTQRAAIEAQIARLKAKQ